MQVKHYYTYEIYVDDPASDLYGAYYYGKRESYVHPSIDNYYGSGTIIRRYIAKHGVDKLRKRVLCTYSTRDELNIAEKQLIDVKRNELESKCLNRHEGGSGGHWVEYCTPEEYEERRNKVIAGVYEKTTPEERALNAKNAGLSKRNVSPERKAEWSKNYKARHARMTKEEKLDIYSQVSTSLETYYKTASLEELEQRRLKNQKTNQETAKLWRAEFFDMFHRTPESFRRCGKMGEAIQLYKKLKEKTKVEINHEINQFMESIIE